MISRKNYLKEGEIKMKHLQIVGKALFLAVNLLILSFLTGCATSFSSIGHTQYERLPIEETAGQIFSQKINGLAVSAARRFDLSFGCYGNNILPVYITILNKSKNSYKITDYGGEEYVVPRISLVKKYIDSPQDAADPDDFYAMQSHYSCNGILKNIDMAKAYRVEMDKEGVAREACAKEVPFRNLISSGSTLEGFAFFHAQPFVNMDEDIGALRLELEIKNMDTGKEVIFLVPLGDGFNFKERFRKIKSATFGMPMPLSIPGFRKPVWIEEEISLEFGELWQKAKRSLFEMKDVQYLSQDTDNKEFNFNLPLSKAELESSVSADLSKFHKEFLKSATAHIRIRLKESGVGKTKIGVSAAIMMGWLHINSNGKLEKDFLGKLKTSFGLKKYEWLGE